MRTASSDNAARQYPIYVCQREASFRSSNQFKQAEISPPLRFALVFPHSPVSLVFACFRLFLTAWLRFACRAP